MRTHSDYVPLHLHTEYSLLDGAIKIDELVRVAKGFRLPALAITDHGNLFGAIEFYQKVSKAGIKPIIGAEVYVAPESRFKKHTGTSPLGKGADSVARLTTQERQDNAYHLILLARDLAGYKNLMKLVSLAHLEGFYYKPRIDNELLEQYSGGLICLSSCMKGEIPSLLMKGDIDGARRRALYYKNLFGPENFYLELQANGIPEQMELNKKLHDLSREIHVGVVATNDCHYLRREDAKAHEILLCIQTNKTIHDQDRMKFQTDEFYFKSPEEIKRDFQTIPEAIKNTIIIAERCNLTLELGRVFLPEFKTPNKTPPDLYLERIAMEWLRKRFLGEPPQDYLLRLKEELQMIKRMGYSSYFLIVWDFIKFAKEIGIPVGPGRGSAAGSLVAWSLGITEIDPIRYGLLFERFLNLERVSMPDIDVDFCKNRRDEVIRYVQKRYGKDQVAQIITFGTMASRAVVRDVGRVLGLPYQDVDRIAKLIPVSATKEINLKKAIEQSAVLKEVYESNSQIRDLLDIAMKLEGLVRHASIHAAGVVIAPGPLTEYTALYRGSRDETITTQFDLESIEKIGLIKFDFLGLDTLTIIDTTVKYIKEKDKDFDLSKILLDDEVTYNLLRSGKTAGIFQLESAGMRELLVKMAPDRFDDLIALVALYRPGPLGSGMVDDFINRKKGIVPFEYEITELKEILEETYGVILYQEQVMRISNKVAGFTLGQADILRRAISKKDPFLMEELKTRFIGGAIERGYSEEKAKRLFELIEFFGNYGFNKSHSAAYAFVAYQTAYLKAHYPVEFMAASLSAEVDKTDKVIKLINECRAMGIDILPPDINKSGEGFTIEGNAIRFGLMAVKGVGSGAISVILMERSKGEFCSFEDFLSRLVLDTGSETSSVAKVTAAENRRLNKKVIEALIKAGSFDSLGINRKKAFEILSMAKAPGEVSKRTNHRQKSIQPSMFNVVMQETSVAEVRFSGGSNSYAESVAKLTLQVGDEDKLKDTELDEIMKLSFEKEALGFYITGHPLQPLRNLLRTFGVKAIEDLKRTVTFATSVAQVTVDFAQENFENLPPDLFDGEGTFATGGESNISGASNSYSDSIVQQGPVTVAGLILDIKKHRTKGKNELMSFITLEDEYGIFEAVVFPELYKKSQGFLEKGSTIILKGKVDLSEKGLKIISEEITQFEIFMRERLRRCSKISLRLEHTEFEKERLLRLLDLVKMQKINTKGPIGGENNSCGNSSIVNGGSNSGEFTIVTGIPLYIELTMPDCSVTIQSSYTVTPDIKIFKKIQDILGKNKVEVIY